MKVALIALLIAQPLHAADFDFCWVGASGYTMAGRIAFSDALLGTGRITGDQIDRLWIEARHHGRVIGQWSTEELTHETSWNLNFDTDSLSFPTGGDHRSATGQAWNAGTSMTDCGNPGLGFNSGSGYQDLCVDGVFVTASSIARDTPFPVARDGVPTPCDRPVPLS